MTHRDENLYGLLPNSIPNLHMVVQLRFDRESFDALKELLRVTSALNAPNSPRSFVSGGLRTPSEESVSSRREREALKRVFDQIRDVGYDSV
jgi:hypothetical protein